MRNQRRFQAFCIGSGKTGTATVARMFSYYRSKHEPIPALTNEIVVQNEIGITKDITTQNLLRKRDRDLCLEMDSSHALGFIPGLLHNEFPEALMIVTIRNPLSWIRSRIRYHAAVSSPAFGYFRDCFWWSQGKPYQPEDRFLQIKFLCSVDSYFAAYEEQYRRIRNLVPPISRIHIRTEELSSPRTAARLEAKLLLEPGTLLLNQSNTQPPAKEDITEPLSDKFLTERVYKMCPKAFELWKAI